MAWKIRKKIFNDTKTAFKLKSDTELDRAIFLFSMMGRPTLVKSGIALTKMSLKLKLPVEGLIKKTIFEQFAGGETMEDCKPTIKTMYQAKLHSILDYSVEGKETEEEFDAAVAKKIELIKFANEEKEVPFAVFKPTGVGRFEIWEKMTAKVSLSDEEKDELYEMALKIVKTEKKASTSFLQRKLQIGYNRAARIIDQMEDNGIVSKANHVGKREVL